ncbi:MAG: hypothetical protein V3V14_08985, partial [Saprospiraceae bacterium]
MKLLNLLFHKGILASCFLFLTTIVHSQQYDVALTKSTVTSIPVKYNTAIPFNLTIYNQGTDSITNIEIIEHFGDGYEYQGGLNPTWNLHATIPNAAVTTYTDIISPGEFVIVTINLLAKPAPNRVDWINTAEVVSFTDTNGINRENEDLDSTGDENPDNDAGGLLGSPADDAFNGNGTGGINDGIALTDEDDHDRDTVKIFDLALVKKLDPITGHKYGDTLTFVSTIYNQGNMAAKFIRVRDIVPEGYINPIGMNIMTGWSSDATNPIYTISNLAVGDSIDVSIDLILSMTMVNENAWENYTEIISARDENNANVSAYDADSTPASNTDGERSIEEGDPDDNYIGNNPVNPEDQDDHDPAEPEIFDLALIKERSTAAPSFSFGNPIDYNYTVVNQGNIVATDIVIVDSLPCGAFFDPVLNPDWEYDSNTNIATLTIAGPMIGGDQYDGILVLNVVVCYDDPTTAWTNYMEIAQATNKYGIQTEEIDGVFDNMFKNDNGGVPNESSDNQLDGDGLDDEDNHDVELLQVYDLALKKELLTMGPYYEGQLLDFRIRVYNQGNIVIEDLIVEDFIPEGLGYDPAINEPLGWTNTFTTNVGGVPTVFPDTLNILNDIFLASGDSVDIITKLTLEFDGENITDWYNYAHIFVATDTIGNNRFDDADSNPFTTTDLEFAVIPGSDADNNIFSAGKSLNPRIEEDDHDVAAISFFDLSLSKTLTTVDPIFGELVTFDIVVKNEGTQFAHDITITDYLPCGLVFNTDDNDGWAMDGSNATYFYTDTIYSGDSIIVPISLLLQECATSDVDSYINVAEISDALNDDDITGVDQDSTPDNDPDNDPTDEDDIDSAPIEIFDLSLTKEFLFEVDNNPLLFDIPVSYSITVYNEGTVPAHNVVVTEYIPCGFAYDSAFNTENIWIEDALSGQYRHTIEQSINPGDSVMLVINLSINDGCPEGEIDV